MELFDHSGHLTDTALRALSGGELLAPLERLEIAEHLSFCDECLMRSTDLLSDVALLAPEHSCLPTLWAKIRQRAARVFFNRYATAAAALVIVVSMWSFGVFGDIVDRSAHLTERDSPLTQQLTQVTDSVGSGLGWLGSLFDFRGADNKSTFDSQGGTHP